MNKTNVELTVSDFLQYAFSGDTDLKGFVECGSKLIVWSHYMDLRTVTVWELIENEFSELVVSIIVDGDVTAETLADPYSESMMVSEPYKTHHNISVAHDFMNILAIYV